MEENINTYNELIILKQEIRTTKRNVETIFNKITEIVKKEVEIQLQQKQLNKVISNLIKTEIKENFNDYLKTVINDSVKTIIKSLREELNTAKKISYSINKEIQHALMHSTCTMEEHDIFIKRMERMFVTIESEMLENKKLLKIENMPEV